MTVIDTTLLGPISRCCCHFIMYLLTVFPYNQASGHVEARKYRDTAQCPELLLEQ